MVTLTTHKDVRSYPCRSMESAIKLAERFIAGVTRPGVSICCLSVAGRTRVVHGSLEAARFQVDFRFRLP